MITLTKEDAFTIVDIISKTQEVIRCKDCKYWNDGTCEMLGTVHMNAEDFCSRGEKR